MVTTLEREIDEFSVPDHFPELSGAGNRTEAALALAPELSQGARPRGIPFLAVVAVATQNPFGMFATVTACMAMTAVWLTVFRAMRFGVVDGTLTVVSAVLLALPLLLAALALRAALKAADLLKSGTLSWGVITAARTVRMRERRRISTGQFRERSNTPPQIHWQLDYSFRDGTGAIRTGTDQTRVRGDAMALLKNRFVIVCSNETDSLLVGMIPGKVRITEKGEVTMSSLRQFAGLLPILAAIAGPAVLAWFMAQGGKPPS